MGSYRCINCGYEGDRLIFQFTDYTYCMATNEEEPEYISDTPQWVKDQSVGEAMIGEPVGCPECHTWGIHNLERSDP